MSNELDELAAKVGAIFKAKGEKRGQGAKSLLLATAESCTGGGIAEAITRIPGSSEWFDRGFVTYSNEAKVEMLGVESNVIDRYGAVSDAVVRQMAEGALARSKAHVAVAVTGVAGPGGGTVDKPVGTVWFAWVVRDKSIISERCMFKGDRAAIRRQTIMHALSKLLHN
jgi:nicotinamide-nucleotide amidase